jgi:hypothetical protein
MQATHKIEHLTDKEQTSVGGALNVHVIPTKIIFETVYPVPSEPRYLTQAIGEDGNPPQHYF